MDCKILAGRRYESPFSVEELLNLVIHKKQSADIDMDPCKAPAFIGEKYYSFRNITLDQTLKVQISTRTKSI